MKAFFSLLRGRGRCGGRHLERRGLSPRRGLYRVRARGCFARNGGGSGDDSAESGGASSGNALGSHRGSLGVCVRGFRLRRQRILGGTHGCGTSTLGACDGPGEVHLYCVPNIVRGYPNVGFGDAGALRVNVTSENSHRVIPLVQFRIVPHDAGHRPALVTAPSLQLARQVGSGAQPLGVVLAKVRPLCIHQLANSYASNAALKYGFSRPIVLPTFTNVEARAEFLPKNFTKPCGARVRLAGGRS